MALRVLQALEQSGCCPLWILRDKMGQVCGHSLRPWAAWQKKADPSYAEWGDSHWEAAHRDQERSASRRRGDTPRGRRNSPRQKTQATGKGKGKDKDSRLSPFAPLGGQPPVAPWPTSETTFSTSSMNVNATPFAPQAPLPPPPTVPPDPASEELVVAVKGMYPDITKAPQNIQKAVEKAEKMNIKTIGAALQKASDRVKKANNKMQDLRASQAKHKESWQKHLQEAISCWEGQVQAYVSQQSSYRAMMQNARAELQAARQDVQRLNHLAAGPLAAVQPARIDLTEPDADNQNLMERLQGVLQQCTQLMLRPERAGRAAE
eukprot:s4_g17.t1